MALELTLSGLLLLAAYLLGSFPTGYLAAWLLKGIDIREQGSGSTGATNVLRTLGKGPALVVLLIDALKGVGAIALVNGFYALTETPEIPTTDRKSVVEGTSVDLGIPAEPLFRSKGPALVVLLIDALKGVGAIALVNGFYALTETPEIPT